MDTLDFILFGILAAVGAGIAVWKNPRLKEYFSSTEGLNPKVWALLIIGSSLLIFNYIVSTIIPWLWNILNFSSATLVAFNLGLGSLLFLRTLKAKDESGKTTKETDPTASKFANLIAIALLAGLGATATLNWQQGDLSPEAWKKKQAEEKVRQRMFEEIPVLRAVYAHNKADRHFEVKDDNIEAANVYKTRGLIQWQETMEKWELAINPGVPDMIPFILAIVEAPAGGGWSQKIKIPKIRGTWTDWKTHSPGCELMAEGDEESIFPCEDTPFEERVEYIQFRSTGEKPLQVEVFVRR